MLAELLRPPFYLFQPVIQPARLGRTDTKDFASSAGVSLSCHTILEFSYPIDSVNKVGRTAD